MSDQNFMTSRVDGASRIEVEKVGVFTYVGMADVGILRSEPKWSLQRIETHSTGKTITWAEGNAIFNKTMDSFVSYTYS